MASCYAVIYTKPVLLPLVMALLITLILRPVHRVLCKVRLPPPLAAAVLIALVIAGLGAGFWNLATPAGKWASTLDMEYAEERIKDLFEPVKEMQKGIEDVANKVDSIAEGGKDDEVASEKDGSELPGETGDEKPAPNKPVAVEIRQGPASEVLAYAQSLGIHAVATLLLIFFLLAYGDVFRRHVAESGSGEELFDSVGHDVSAYLFTISAINAGLGVCIAVAMWFLDMPNAILWGVMAMFLNYVPYLGALMGTAVVGFVAVVTFATPFEALMVPVIYFSLTAVEGNVVTPMLIGRRFALNPIIVVVWFLAWGSMWGIAGMLIATPTLMAFKIICASQPGLNRIERIISR